MDTRFFPPPYRAGSLCIIPALTTHSDVGDMEKNGAAAPSSPELTLLGR